MGRSASALEVERTLSAIAERALHLGARAGLDALVEATIALTETSGAALYAGSRRVALAGLAPPAPARAHPQQMMKDGRTVLVLGEPCADAADRQLLARLVVLGSALLASQSREDRARVDQIRLRQERMRLKELQTHRERVLARAAHDLRTPLLVLQGYIDMMSKGMAGVLTPSMQRYLDRMGRAATEMNARLQRPPLEHAPVEDLRALLSATFGPGRLGCARLELPAEPVRVRVPRDELVLLVRTLERLLVGAGASERVLRLEAQDGAQWRLSLQARAERPLPERTLALLERLTQRLEAGLSVRGAPEVELTVSLPSRPG